MHYYGTNKIRMDRPSLPLHGKMRVSDRVPPILRTALVGVGQVVGEVGSSALPL